MIDKAAKDHELLLAIHSLLDGVEWSTDTLDAIAALMESYGYPIRDIGENHGATRHDHRSQRDRR